MYKKIFFILVISNYFKQIYGFTYAYIPHKSITHNIYKYSNGEKLYLIVGVLIILIIVFIMYFLEKDRCE
jgi:hypothetical protein